MMSPEVMEVGSPVRKHGPCHRCGWIMDVSKVDRRSARELGVHARMQLCDDCLTDLQHRSIVTLGTQVNERANLWVTHRRRVA